VGDDIMDTKKTITIQAVINAPVEKVWQFYTKPEHIMQWNHASDDWHSPRAENDLKPGGKFNYRMEAKDGSSGFDFYGTYEKIKTNELIDYTIGDGRKVMVTFSEKKQEIHVEIKFEAESTHSIEMQRNGWQAILDNFKKYVEEKHHDKI
jgi:uncharacterized protein YndB with AHSA1/START domain